MSVLFSFSCRKEGQGTGSPSYCKLSILGFIVSFKDPAMVGQNRKNKCYSSCRLRPVNQISLTLDTPHYFYPLLGVSAKIMHHVEPPPIRT